MRSTRTCHHNAGAGALAVSFALAALCLFGVIGCGTVHQKVVEAKEAATYARPQKLAGGFVIDADFRDRYNALIAVYGNHRLENGAPVFIPPLQKDDGITEWGGGKFFMTEHAYENMYLMLGFQKRGAAP